MSDAIRAKLAETAARYPFPPEEAERTRRRQWILRLAARAGVGAEIGVYRGHFSEYLLAILAPRKMYFIDPWTKVGEHFTLGGAYSNNNTLPTRAAFEESVLKARLQPQTQAVFIEDFFPACVSFIEDRLDWIYLDAAPHAYDNTLVQLKAADLLLASGGVIMGDDWHPNPAHRHHGVFRAVNAFVKSHDYELIAAGPELQWCIRRATRYDDSPAADDFRQGGVSR